MQTSFRTSESIRNEQIGRSKKNQWKIMQCTKGNSPQKSVAHRLITGTGQSCPNQRKIPAAWTEKNVNFVSVLTGLEFNKWTILRPVSTHWQYFQGGSSEEEVAAGRLGAPRHHILVVRRLEQEWILVLGLAGGRDGRHGCGSRHAQLESVVRHLDLAGGVTSETTRT